MFKKTYRLASTMFLPAALVLSAIGVPVDAGETRQPWLEPLPDEVPAPEDNPTTPEKVVLGKQLFFDPRLSGDGQMSCATCHLPEKAFTDGRPRALGAEGDPLPRNTLSLLNVGFQQPLMWDGRADSLEEQSLMPIESPDEMNHDLTALVQKLSRVPGYVEQFENVFGTQVTKQGVAQALAAFQRTLVSRNSPLDRYLKGDTGALSPLAQEGMRLFTGDAGCIRCHHGPLLSDGQFYRLGAGSTDPGRGAISGDPEDRFKFRTPSLRDVEATGPYMHDGSQQTLFEVVEFYYRTAPATGPEGTPLDIEPLLGQSYSEIDALVAFLRSLSGERPEITPPELPQ